MANSGSCGLTVAGCRVKESEPSGACQISARVVSVTLTAKEGLTHLGLTESQCHVCCGPRIQQLRDCFKKMDHPPQNLAIPPKKSYQIIQNAEIDVEFLSSEACLRQLLANILKKKGIKSNSGTRPTQFCV
jgi:hypothetical protein